MPAMSISLTSTRVPVVVHKTTRLWPLFGEWLAKTLKTQENLQTPRDRINPSRPCHRPYHTEIRARRAIGSRSSKLTSYLPARSQASQFLLFASGAGSRLDGPCNVIMRRRGDLRFSCAASSNAKEQPMTSFEFSEPQPVRPAQTLPSVLSRPCRCC
jgi:hypothetical protein